jgi:hypothetical protein
MYETGKWYTQPHSVRVLITLHPAALLRMLPAIHAAAYSDWINDLEIAHALRYRTLPRRNKFTAASNITAPTNDTSNEGILKLS